VAVAAQGDPDRRPVGPDAADHAPEQGQDLPAARAFGGTQDRRDQPAAGVEDHDRLEAVLVVVGVEQLELLGAVGGVEGVVQIEHDPVRNLRERGAVLVDQRLGHAVKIRARRQVLEPGHRRLRA
jgi:hypothetical protein